MAVAAAAAGGAVELFSDDLSAVTRLINSESGSSGHPWNYVYVSMFTCLRERHMYRIF